MPRIPVEDEVTENDTQSQLEVTENDGTFDHEVANEAPADSSGELCVRQRKGIRPAMFLVCILILGLLGACIFLYNDRQDLGAQVAELSARPPSSEDEAADLKREVGVYIQLPDNELPTIATVVDINKVKDQAFFVKSENGDKVLIFVKSGKAILYRPSTKKIIEIAPINLNQEQTSTNSSSR